MVAGGLHFPVRRHAAGADTPRPGVYRSAVLHIARHAHGAGHMRIGMVGLGKMGANMATRLLRGGHEVVVYDRSADAVRTAAEGGAVAADSLAALVAALGDAGTRAAWVMVPAGDPTESTVQSLGALLAAGDVVVDGGNSNYKDSARRARELAGRGVLFVDSG